MIAKNEQYVVKIIDFGMNGEGIAKIDDFTIFVDGGIKDETIKIQIVKVLKNYGYGKIIEIINPSKYRIENIDCKTYKRCGGCNLRHIKYEETLEIKKEKVQNLVNKNLEQKVQVQNTIGMENPYYYRNKAIFPINIKEKEPGIFAKRTHEVIPFDECKIQTKISQDIAKYIVKNWKQTFYDEEKKKGILRNIMIRQGFKTKEIMVVLVLNYCFKNSESFSKDFLDIHKLIKKFPGIKSVIINENTKNTNVVLSDKNICIYGKEKIEDYLGKYKFEISPNSFYQVNPYQTEKMYNLAVKEANLKDTDIICDLYCGIGTIGIFASNLVKKVYGIEIVDKAVENAKQNAKINNIKNIGFLCGSSEEKFDEILKNGVKPNICFVDPPRKGLDAKTVENLKKLNLEKLIYISCNPATLVRDLKELEKNYKIEKMIPIDQFCFTQHVEVITILSKKTLDF